MINSMIDSTDKIAGRNLYNKIIKKKIVTIICTVMTFWQIYVYFSGTYSYVDPKHKVRTVEYKADKNGFHPVLINFNDTFAQPADSETVRLAKERHMHLYQKIAKANAHNVPVNLPRVIVLYIHRYIIYKR